MQMSGLPRAAMCQPRFFCIFCCKLGLLVSSIDLPRRFFFAKVACDVL